MVRSQPIPDTASARVPAHVKIKWYSRVLVDAGRVARNDGGAVAGELPETLEKVYDIGEDMDLLRSA